MRKPDYKGRWQQKDEGNKNWNPENIKEKQHPVGKKRMSPSDHNTGSYAYQKKWESHIPVGGSRTPEYQKEQYSASRWKGRAYGERYGREGPDKQILRPRPYERHSTDRES